MPSPPSRRELRIGTWGHWRTWSAALLAALAIGQSIGLPTAWLRRGVLHVSPAGSDLLIGQSRQLAVRSLQRALSLAAPGETILLWPGVYRETVLLRRGGAPGRPLRLRAARPGTAVISGAAPPEAAQGWAWQPAGRRRFRTRPPWPLQALRVDGLESFSANNRSEFERLCARPGAWPVFLQQPDGQLLLCLPGGRAPTAHRLSIHRSLVPRSTAGGHQNASLWIEASHLEISGLVFDFAVGAAIQLVAASDVRIADNLFSGADVGVNDNPSRRAPRRIRIEHNAFVHAPQYRWRGWLSWRELYRHSNSSLAWLSGADLSLNHNLILESGDGLKLSPTAGRNQVRGNLIVASTDDALELDGTAAPLRIEDNLISDSFANLSFSAMPVGPALVRRNRFLNGPRNGHSTWLKLLGGPVRQLTLSDNWVVGDWLGWYAGGHPLSIVSRRNRLFVQHGIGPAASSVLPAASDRLQKLPPALWPEAAAGPAGLNAAPLNLNGVGPCWLDPRRTPPFQQLAPLLRSGWLQQPFRPGRCR